MVAPRYNFSPFLPACSIVFGIVLLITFSTVPAIAFLGESDAGTRGGTRVDYFEALDYGDFNKDGLPDFITSSAAVGVIRFWMDDGGGLAGFPLNFTMGSLTRGLATADMDKDGWPDIVLGASSSDITIAYNTKNGSFLRSDVDSATAGVSGVDVADIDLDGDLDIIGGDASGNVRVVENQGGGTYAGTDSTTISSNTITKVQVGDMNLDGKPDAVLGTAAGGVYVSNGAGTLSLGSPVSAGSASGEVMDLKLEDLDRDGDLDIVTGDASGEVAFFKNNRGSYAKSVLATYSDDIGALETTDLDFDGDHDIFVASGINLYYIDNGRTNFNSYAYSTQDKDISIIGCGDWDTDGDTDIFIGKTSLSIGLIERTTPIQDVGDFIANPLELCAGNALSVDCIDIDLDGLGDAIVGDSTGAFYKYLNNGDGTYSRTLIDSRATGVISLCAGDIDQDGDMDIAVGEDSNVVSLYTNTGSSFSSADLDTLAGKPTDLEIADYNSDGNTDILATTDVGDLDALKNNGGGFTKVTLGSAAATPSFNCLAVGDVDMDGDLDVALGDSLNNLRFFNNSGTDSFTGSILGNLLSTVNSVNLADMNSDGDLDIVAGCESNKIYVTEYRRQGFKAPSSVANATSGIRGLYLEDMNHDDFMDVITGDSNNEITLHTNRGGTFENKIMSVVQHPINDICAFDMNTDGGLDVVSVNTSGGVTEHTLSYIPLPFVEKVMLTNGHGSQGKVCYAGYSSAYRFKVNVTNPDGYLGVDYVVLTLDPGGLDLKYKWINDAGLPNPFSVLADTNDHTNLLSDRPDESYDSNKNWMLNFELEFNWNFPTDQPLGVEATVFNKQGLFGSLSVGDVFLVESALVAVGDPEPYYQGQTLEYGGWVAGGSNITWKGLKVAYKYNTNHAPYENYTLVIKGEDSPKKEFTVRYGLPIDVVSDVADLTIQNETFNISFKNMPSTFEEKSFEFDVNIDNNPPAEPNNVVIHRSFAQPAKVTFDNDGKLYVTWDPVNDPDSGTLGYKYSFESSGDGIFAANNSVNVSTDGVGKQDIYVWAVDVVGNEGNWGYNTIFIDREAPALLDHYPNSTVNTTDMKVECGIQIKDIGGSGLDYNSIKYSYSTTGLTGFSEWKPIYYNSSSYPEVLSVSARVPFGDLDRNYIKWSASDLAGNEWVSESWNVKLNIQEEPFEGVTLSVKDKSHNYILLSWTPAQIDPAEFMKYDVYQGYSEDFNPTISNLKISINDPSIVEYNVTGLTAESTYFFKVRVYNKDNINADSNELNVTTPAKNGGEKPPVNTDVDLDGLDDTWEMDHFGSLDQGPDDDYDDDGHTNEEEFEDRTDPTDPEDPLPVTPLDDDDDNDKTLFEQYGLFIIVFIIVFVIVVMIILFMAWSKSQKKDDEDRGPPPEEPPRESRSREHYGEATPVYSASGSSPSKGRTREVAAAPRTTPLPAAKTKTLPTTRQKTLPPPREADMVYEYADEEEPVYEDGPEMDDDFDDDYDDDFDDLDMEDDSEAEPEEEELPEMAPLDDEDEDWGAGESEEDNMDLLSWDEED